MEPRSATTNCHPVISRRWPYCNATTIPTEKATKELLRVLQPSVRKCQSPHIIVIRVVSCFYRFSPRSKPHVPYFSPCACDGNAYSIFLIDHVQISLSWSLGHCKESCLSWGLRKAMGERYTFTVHNVIGATDLCCIRRAVFVCTGLGEFNMGTLKY